MADFVRIFYEPYFGRFYLNFLFVGLILSNGVFHYSCMALERGGQIPPPSHTPRTFKSAFKS